MAWLLPEVFPRASPTDHELVRAVRRGEVYAFEELFSRYRERIRSYATGILADFDRAEDITQVVFISALGRLRATERPIAFKPWIYQIAKNACIDELRRTRRSLEVSLDQEQAVSEAGPDLASHAPGPEVALESKLQLDDLFGALRGVSDLHHRILVLRELEGLSYSEIGARLDMSRPMVESTLFRARRRLAEEYQELTSGDRCERMRALIDGSRGQTLKRLGTRERRRLVRHIAHCQTCRRHAVLARSAAALPDTAAGSLAAAGRRRTRSRGRRAPRG